MRHRALAPLLLFFGIIVFVAMIPRCFETSTSGASTGLSGESMHDFGEVDLAEGSLTLNHSFALINETEKAIPIREVRWSCGCLNATVDSDRVDPGTQVDVSTAIRIYSPGRHHERVTLVLDDETIRVLELRAIARRGLRISALPPQVRLADGEVARVTLLASDDRSDRKPDILKVEAPEGIAVDLGTWSALDPGRLDAAIATRWELPVSVRANDIDHSTPVQIVISFADHEPIVLPVLFE